MSDQYANELETFFAGLPALAQELLYEPFTWMNNSLRAVAGDPPKLLAAGCQYADIAMAVRQMEASHTDDVDLLGQFWTGAAFSAFATRQQDLEVQLVRTAQAIAEIDEVLRSAADACVAAADAIIHIVVDLIEVALGIVAVNLALAALSLGTSALAGAAELIAEGAKSMADVVRVVQRLAALLDRVVVLMRRLETLLAEVKKVVESIQAWLQQAKEASKAAKWSDWGRVKVIEGAKRTLVSKASLPALWGTCTYLEPSARPRTPGSTLTRGIGT